MSKKEKDWNKVEQNYLQMKEQELEQVDLPELWSRIEEKLDQSRSEERTALVDFCDPSESGADQSSQMNEAQESTNKEIASEMEKATGRNNSETEDSASQDSVGQYDAISQNEKEQVDEETFDSSTSKESAEKAEATLLTVEKENGYYELSMDVEISDLQLMETSVDNKAELSLIAYSEFSDTAREVLQEKISDISSYAFYINLEGILYIEREGHYYQMVVSVRR